MAYGFGGLGASFPMRYSTPESNRVMTDSEFEADLRSKLPSSTITRQLNLAPGTSGYNAAAASPYMDQINNSNWTALQNDFAGADQNALKSVFDLVNKNGLVLGNSSSGPTFGRSAYSSNWGGGGSHLVGDTWSETNPEYASAVAEMNRQIQARQQNQTAQQQAYNGMIGNGQMNGILGPDYSKPGFGQVNGQTTNPYAPNSGGKGVDMGWTSGVYDPVNAYQSGMYGTTGSPKNQWGF